MVEEKIEGIQIWDTVLGLSKHHTQQRFWISKKTKKKQDFIALHKVQSFQIKFICEKKHNRTTEFD